MPLDPNYWPPDLDLWIAALKYMVKYNACCPEVGMGESLDATLRKLEEEVGSVLTSGDRRTVLGLVAKGDC